MLFMRFSLPVSDLEYKVDLTSSSATVIKCIPFLLSLAFKSIGGKYYPCQIISCISNGKLNYFKRNFHIRFAAARCKNVRKPQGELGRVNVTSCYPNHPQCLLKLPLALELKSEPYSEEREHFDSFFSLKTIR